MQNEKKKHQKIFPLCNIKEMKKNTHTITTTRKNDKIRKEYRKIFPLNRENKERS